MEYRDLILHKLDTSLTEAFLAGKQAFYNGQSRGENPFDELSEEYQWWLAGWSESKHEGSE